MVGRQSRSWHRTVCTVGLLLSAGASLAAADGLSTAPEMPMAQQILELDRDLQTRVVGLGRVRWSHPQELSGSLGAIIARLPADYDCAYSCEYRGLLLQAEPGLAGGQLSAGYAVVTGDKGERGQFLTDIHLAYGIKGVLMRTWGDADLDPAAQTLLGIEGEFTVIGVNFSLGLFHEIGPTDPADDWVVSGGIGWAF